MPEVRRFFTSEPHHEKKSQQSVRPRLNLTILRMDENTMEGCEVVGVGGGGGGGRGQGLT